MHTCNAYIQSGPKKQPFSKVCCPSVRHCLTCYDATDLSSTSRLDNHVHDGVISYTTTNQLLAIRQNLARVNQTDLLQMHIKLHCNFLFQLQTHIPISTIQHYVWHSHVLFADIGYMSLVRRVTNYLLGSRGCVSTMYYEIGKLFQVVFHKVLY